MNKVEMNQMELHTKILGLRKKSGITQQVMAESLNVSRQTISKWETGAVMPDVANLTRIANLFQVSVDYLLNVECADGEVELSNDVLVEDTDGDEQQEESEQPVMIASELEVELDVSCEGTSKKKKMFLVLCVCFLSILSVAIVSFNSPTITKLYLVFLLGFLGISLVGVVFLKTKRKKGENDEDS